MACSRAGVLALGVVAAQVGGAAADDSHLRSIALLWSRAGCAPVVSVAGGAFYASATAFDSVCPGGVCERVRVYVPAADGSAEMVRLRGPNVALARRVDSLDLASLAITSPDIGYIVPAAVAEPVAGQVIRVLDFPACERLVGHYGLMGRERVMDFTTTIPTHAVDRGAIVLDDRGAAIGIVRSRFGYAPGFAGALTGTIARWVGKVVPAQTGAVRTSAARAVLGGAEHESLTAEVALWNRAYDESLASGRTLDRLRAALAFRTGVGLVGARALTADAGRSVADALAGSYQLGLESIARLAPASGTLGEQGERLAVAYALSTRGLLGPLLRPLDVDAILARLRASTRSAAHVAALEAMVDRERSASPFAPAGAFLVLMVGLAALALALTAVWAWTLGFVFKAARGGFFVRGLKTAFVALAAWPASLLAFWAVGAALRRRREARALSLVPDGWTL